MTSRHDRTGADSRPHFRPDIEGLRGVAVLAVVLYHARVAGWGGGFVGVDVFFVISGYLITGLLVKELEHSGRINFAQFFARRVRRLLPASMVVLAATLIVASIVLSPDERVTVAQTARATGAYLSNVYFISKASDYFAVSNDTNPLLHTWSLAVEEQFYFIWPLLIVGAFRGVRPHRTLAYATIALSAGSFVLCALFTKRATSLAFFGTPFRAWEFGAGALASLVPARLSVNEAVRRACVLLGATAIAASILLFTSATRFPGIAAFLPVAGTAVLMWAGTDQTARATAFLLDHAPLTFLGRLSYSWYLWHWPVLVFGAAIWPDLSQAGRLLLATVSLGLAGISYAAVEVPFRVSRHFAARPQGTLAVAAASTLLSVLGSSIVGRLAWREAQSPAQRAIAYATRIPDAYAAHCVNGAGDAALHACAFGDTAAHAVAVLFGDSHAAQWAPGMEVDARRRGWRLILLLKSGCPAAAFDVRTGEGSDFPDCKTWRANALLEIERLHPQLVIVSSARVYVGDAVRKPPNLAEPITASDWTRGYRETLLRLVRPGTQVVLLHDSPVPGLDVPVCLARGGARASIRRCTVARDRAVPPSLVSAERAAVIGLTQATTVDLTDDLCSPTVCPPVKNGVIVYRDWNHLSVGIVEGLTSVIDQRLGDVSDVWRRSATSAASRPDHVVRVSASHSPDS